MHGVVACRDGGKKSRDCVRWDQDFAFLWRFFCFAGGEERSLGLMISTDKAGRRNETHAMLCFASGL